MIARSPWLVAVLSLAVVGSALGVVYSKYLSRKNFVELQALRSERDRMDIRWGRLQLEEGTLATFPRVEAKARGELGMHIPRTNEVVVLKGR